MLQPFIKSFKLKETYRGIKPFTVRFHAGINVIVGENGSGKSTMLELLTDQPTSKNCEIDYVKGTTFRFFDTEKSNPRIRSFDYSKTIGFDLASRFASHGEAMLPIVQACNDFKDTIVIVDEPEAGLSLRNQQKILDLYNNLVEKNNIQVILTTHSYIIIKGSDCVFDMSSHKWWLNTNVYLNNILKKCAKQ